VLLLLGGCSGSDGGGKDTDGGTVVDTCGGTPVKHWCVDSDGDGHGDAAKALDTCQEPVGYSETCDDTDDAHAAVYPGASEVCDGLDDDGNGKVDDRTPACDCTDGQTQDCGGAVGECHLGTQTCADGAWGECTGGVIPVAETCDGLDNDCNGTVDDRPDDPCECTDGATRACGGAAGECRAGSQTCAEGHWGDCTGAVMPTAETCNGKDDDCNGVNDDTGASEMCNGVDDDCDGHVDEGLGVGDACVVGVGACRREGLQICDPAGTGLVVCSVTAGQPGAEACDGLDNDCNGLVDDAAGGCSCNEGATQLCGSDVGECRRGLQTCTDGHFGACEGQTGPAAETCNGRDDDCDGTVDNRAGDACECADGAERACGSPLGECSVGTQACADGHWGACSGDAPTAETCDGLDNDCDGVVDDRQGVACDCVDGVEEACGNGTGACIQGSRTCMDGRWSACDGAVGPTAETCDGVDNDCNGVVDDRAGNACECVDGTDEVCGSDVGTCRQGTHHCTNGRWGECDGGNGPVEDVFDGQDNDCNGTVDDGLPIGLAVRVRTDAAGHRIIYEQAYPEVPSGTVTAATLQGFNEGGNDFISFNNGYMYRFNADAQVFTRFSAAVNDGDYAHPVLVASPTQLSIANKGLRGPAISVYVNNELAVGGMNTADANGRAPTLYRWNPETMELVGDPINADWTKPYYGQRWQVGGSVLWGDYAATAVNWQKNSQALGGYVGYPYLAVGLVKTDGSQDLQIVEDASARCAVSTVSNQFVDEAGDLYVFGLEWTPYVGMVSTNPDQVPPTPFHAPSCALRLRHGELRFDPDFFVDLRAATHACVIQQVHLVRGHLVEVFGIADADCAGDLSAYDPTRRLTNWYVDLDTGVGWQVPGMPKLYTQNALDYRDDKYLYTMGYTQAAVFVDDQGIFHTQATEIWRMSRTDSVAAAQRIFSVSVGDVWGFGRMRVRP
jgi:hypothetical protein